MSGQRDCFNEMEHSTNSTSGLWNFSGNISKLKLSGNKICHPRTCLFGMRILLGGLILRNRRFSKFSFYLFFSCLKNLDKEPGPRRWGSHQRGLQRCGWGKWGLGRAWGQSTLCPSVSAQPSKLLFTLHLLFRLHVKCTSSLWSPKTLPQTSSFVFSWRGHLRWQLGPFWRLILFSWVSPMYTLLNFCVFFSC